jgi:hypothetical protein
MMNETGKEIERSEILYAKQSSDNQLLSREKSKDHLSVDVRCEGNKRCDHGLRKTEPRFMAPKVSLCGIRRPDLDDAMIFSQAY